MTSNEKQETEVLSDRGDVKREVLVTVDNVRHEVRRGDYVVSEFKKLVGVDPSRELDEVVHGELKPLDDNARIEIKGGEVFVSHVRTGGSSSTC